MSVSKIKNIAIAGFVVLALTTAVYYRFFVPSPAPTPTNKNTLIQAPAITITEVPAKVDEDISISSYRYIYKKGEGIQYSSIKERERVMTARNPFYSATVVNPEHPGFFYNLPAFSAYISSEFDRIVDELQSKQAKEINYEKEKISEEIIKGIKFDGVIKSGDIYLIAGGKEYRKGDALPVSLKHSEIKKEQKKEETPALKELKEILKKFKDISLRESSRYEDVELKQAMEKIGEIESNIGRFLNLGYVIENNNVVIKNIMEGGGQYDARVTLSVFGKEHTLNVSFEPSTQYLITDTPVRKLKLWDSGRHS
jgi:hypothetical protein